MSEFHTEQHFELICSPNDANMLDSLLNREPYIKIQQVTTIQELSDGQELHDVWIRFGFEDPLIPKIPSEIQYDKLERIIEDYLEQTRAEDMTYEAFKENVDEILEKDYYNLIRRSFIERSRFHDKVADEMLWAIRNAFKELTGSVPDDNKCRKVLDFWGKTRYKVYDCKEYKIAQHRMEISDTDLADIYYAMAQEINKTCHEFSLFDAIGKSPNKFEDIILKATICDWEATKKWMTSEKERVKEITSNN